MATIEGLSLEFFEAFRPPRKLSLSEWADEYATLSAESSAEAGRWSTIAYQKGIMDAITDPDIEQISVMKSARVGFTKILNHAIGYHIHQDPCSIMMVQPTIEDAEGYSKEEIAPMIRDTPVLTALVSEAKSKDGSNTILAKNFPGGTLGMVGANSPRGFRRVSRRIVLFDEVDGYPPSAGSEGDQIKLGIKRTEYFWNRKIIAGSTPTVKDHSRIERLFEQSDQRRYFVPCPTCGETQYLQWKNLKWPEGEPEKAYFECDRNKCMITHNQKRAMIEKGEWRATAQGNGKHAGFHIWAAYSYSPNATWGQLATEFLEAKGDAESLKTFVNTALAECWEEAYTAKVGADTLKSRAELYDPYVIPARALTLTGAIDVQDNRFAISLYAWGRDEEAWIVGHQEVYGDPAKPEVWKQLDDIIFRSYPHELGGELHVSVVGIDTGGHFTHEAYQYVRERRTRTRHTHVLAFKGSSQRARQPLGKPTKQDINYRGQTLKNGVELYPIGTDTIKTTVFGRMKHNEPGPGFIHFMASLSDDFFKQLTSEKQTVKYVKGFPIREWVKKPGERNEALDVLVYNYACLQFLYTRFNRATIWDQLEKRLPATGERRTADVPMTNVKESEQSALRPDKPPRTIQTNGRKKGFISSW
jgi:phage terminase large subunit GpA-like protein